MLFLKQDAYIIVGLVSPDWQVCFEQQRRQVGFMYLPLAADAVHLLLVTATYFVHAQQLCISPAGHHV